MIDTLPNNNRSYSKDFGSKIIKLKLLTLRKSTSLIASILGILLLLSGFSYSQTISATTYPIAVSTSVPLVTYTSLGTIVNPAVDDGSSAITNIGFDFWYDGVKYTQFAANSNGWLKLGAVVGGSASSQYTNNLAQTNVDDPKIAPYWDDLTTGTNGYVKYGLNGTAPNRTLVVEFRTNLVASGTGMAAGMIYQVVLYETTGQIQFIYGGTIGSGAGYSVGFNKSATIMASILTSTNVVTYGSDPNTAQTTAITAGKAYLSTPPGSTSPSGLSFTGVSTTGMTLNWTDNSSDELGFVIYQSTDGINYTYNSTTAANATSKPITGLTQGNIYYWQVYALREALSSSAASGSKATLPGAPTAVTAVAGNGQATITFTAPTNGTAPITNYTVTGSPGGTATGTTSPITVTGLTNGTAYTFTVTATNATGTSAASTASTAVTPSAPCVAPTVPTSVVAGTTTTTSIPCTITPNGAATGYLVVASTSSTLSAGPVNGTTYAATNPLGGGIVQYQGTATSFTANSTINSNTLYYLFVYSYNTTSCSGGPAYSSTSVTTSATTIPAAPTGVSAVAGNAQATVSFTAPGGTATITNYTVISNPAGGVSPASGTSPITVTGLSNNTSYTFTVTATNAGGTSAPSTASTGVTPLGPCVAPVAQPTGLLLTLSTSAPSTALTISYTAPGMAPSGYLIVRYASGATPTNPVNTTTYTAGASLGAGTVVTAGNVLTFSNTGLTPNTPYDYYVYDYNNTSCTAGPVYNTTSPLMGSITTCLTAPVSNAASLVTTTGFNANWTASSGAVSYLLDVSTSSTFSTFVSGYNGLNVGNVTTYPVMGLSNATVYYYRLRAVGAAGCASLNSNIQNVTTLCGVFTLPYTQNFDGVTAPAIPNCTLVQDVNNDGFTWVTSTSAANSNPNALEYSYNSTTTTVAANDWWFTPGFNLVAGNTYSISFTERIQSATYPEGLEVKEGNAQSAAGMTSVALYSNTALANITYATQTFTFVATSTGTQYFGWHAISAANEYNLFVDDISIVLVPPCTTPAVASGLVLTAPTAGGITGTFSAPSPAATNYLVIRTISSTAPAAPTDGVTYTAGSSALGGVIISTNTTTGFSDGSAAPSTQYWYWIYSYNATSCVGGPLYSSTSLNGNTTAAACSSNTLYWAGLGSSITGHTTSAAFNTAANWSTSTSSFVVSSTAPTACTNVIMPISLATTSATTDDITLSTNTTIASLTMNGNLTANSKKIFFLDALGFNFNILGNVSLSCLGANNAGNSLLLVGSGGIINIGGTTTVGAVGDTHITSIGNGDGATPTTFVFGGNVTYNALAQTNFDNFTNAVFNSSAAQTLNNVGTADGNLSFLSATISSPSLTLGGTSGSFDYVDGGNLVVGSNSSLVIPSGFAFDQYTASTGSLILNGAATLTVGGGTNTATNTVTGSNFPGGFAMYALNAGSNTIYNSASAVTQTIYSPVTYGNLTVTNSTGAGASTKNITANVTGVAGNFTINDFNTVDLSTFNLNRTAAGGTLTLNGTATLRLAGVALTSTGTNNFPGNFSTISLANTSTVEYYGATQTVYSTPTYGNLTITTTGVKTAGGVLNVASNILINTGSTFAASGSNGINVGGNWTTTGTYTKATETVTFNGGAAQAFNPGSSSFNNIAVTNSVGGVSLATNNLITAGTFTVNGAGGFNANTKTNTVTGLTSVTSGTYTAGTGTQVFNGGLTVNGGTFTGSTGAVTATNVLLSSGTLTAPNSTGSFTITGNWTNSGGTFANNTGTVTINGTSGTETIAGSSIFYNLTLSNSGATTDFGTSITTIANNLNSTAGTMTASTSTIIFTGSAGQIIGSSAKRFYNVQINSGANITSPSTSGNLSIANSYTDNGTFTQAIARTTTFNGTGTQTLSGTGTTTFGNVTIQGSSTVSAGSHSFSLLGDWANNGTYTAGTETVTFAGTAAQGYAGPTTFNNLTINSTGVTLNDPATVSSVFALTNGRVTTTATNLLTISNTSPAAVVGGSTTSFVNGPLLWNLPNLVLSSNIYTYPVGVGTTYLPFSATSITSLSLPSLAVQAFLGSMGGTGDGTTLATSGSLSTTEYWVSQTSSGTISKISVNSLTRQTPVSPFNVIAESGTLGGAYTSYGGTPSGNSINNSSNIPTSTNRFYVMGQAPAITITSSLSPTSVTTCAGNASSNMTLSVSGTAMASGITVTPPTGFEVSLSPTTGFGGSISVGSGGNIPSTPVYVRLSAADAVGSYSGNIILSSTGATSVNSTIASSTVNPVPTATISGTATVCQNSTSPNITFTGAGGTAPYTFTYNINGGSNQTATTTSGNSVTVPAATTAAGSYTYNLVSVSGQFCSQLQSGTATVTVNPVPAIANSLVNAACNGSFSVTPASGGGNIVPAGTTYSWSAPTGSGFTGGAGGSNQTSISGTLTNTTSAAVTATYTITPISGTCPGNTFTITVTVPQIPTASISGGPTICSGSAANLSVALTGTSPWTITYFDGSSNTTVSGIASSPYTLTVNPLTTTTYNLVSVTGYFGCDGSVSGSATVTVNPDASVGSVTGTTPLCIGSTATYTANAVVLGGSGTGAWSSGNIAVATVNSSGVVTAVAAGTTNIIYTVTGGCGGTKSAQQAVTVNPNESVGSVTGSSPLCIGGTANYTANAVVLGGTGTGAWSSDNTAVATVDASGVVTAVGAGTANIIYTVSGGCGSTISAQQSLIVNPNASVGSVTGTSPLCIGSTATYTANAVVLGGSTGVWSSDNTAVATVDATGVVTAVAAGSADITYTVSTGCNSPVSAFKTLTVSPNANAGTVSGTTPLIIGQTTTYTSNGDAGGAWSSTDTSVATVNTSTGLVTAISAGTTSITYTVSSGCNNPVNASKALTVYISPLLADYRTQANGNFSVGANWQYNNGISWVTATNPPTSTNNVLILNNIVQDQDFTVGSGKSFIMDPSLPSADTFSVAPTYTLFVAGTANFNHRYVAFKSTISGSGSLGKVTGTISNTDSVIVERYIATGTGGAPNHGKSWQLLSTPTKGQTIKQSWQEGAQVSDVGSTPGSAGNPHPGYGTMLTSNVANAATQTKPGFDYFTSAGPTIKAFISIRGNYVGPDSTGVQLYTPTGYFTFVRGDRSVYTSTGAAVPTVLRSTGQIFTPAYPPDSTTIGFNSFASVGNPYASAIDFRDITRSGVSDFFQVWDPRLGGDYNYGAFQTFYKDPATGNYLKTVAGGSYDSINNIIQSGQAFLVQTADSLGKIKFTEAAKSTGGTTLFTRIADVSQRQSQLRISLLADNNGTPAALLDGALDQFDESYSNEVDNMDARKSLNTGENLSVKSGGKLLTIERRHTVISNDTIYLDISNQRSRVYHLRFEAKNLNSVVSGFIEDNYIHTRTALNLNGITDVSFRVSATASSYAADRFRIVFSPLKVLPVTFTSVKAYKQDKNINVEWTVSNENNIRQYEVEKSGNGTDFTTLAVTKPTNNAGGSAVYIMPDVKPVNGYNYYRIRSVDINAAISYTTIVKVQIGVILQDINISPNPITDGQIHLQFINEPAGKYGLRLLNNIGQVMLAKEVTRQDGTNTELIKWNFNLAHGIYKLEVTNPDGSVKMINVLY